MKNFEQDQTDLQNYYWFKEGFSKEELKKIYDGVDLIPFETAYTLGSIGEVKTNIRKSSIKWIPFNEEWDWLYNRLMEMAVEANKELWNFDLISAPECIQYTEYYSDVDGHYTWHQDIGTGISSTRKISITVQLSDADEYEGGDLEMWKGGDSLITAYRGAGSVFIFPSYMMHRVSKVTKGTRRSFVIWVGGKPYK